MTEEEEWRRFLAREVDLVPHASTSHLQYLRDVPSVKIVPVTEPWSTALFFNLRRQPTADPRVRRLISLALRRRSIASMFTGEPQDAISAEEDLPRAQAILAEVSPPELTLLMYESSSEYQRVGLVIQEQLAQINVRVKLKAVGRGEFERAWRGGDYDCLLFGGGIEPRYWRLLQTGSPANVLGYSNPEFDDAAARKDVEAATRILAQDVPLTPLYVVREGVAMDRRFCGAHPRITSDYSWLARVHVCKEGEVE
jgi:ABC-type transport system substrate-binding protein